MSERKGVREIQIGSTRLAVSRLNGTWFVRRFTVGLNGSIVETIFESVDFAAAMDALRAVAIWTVEKALSSSRKKGA